MKILAKLFCTNYGTYSFFDLRSHLEKWIDGHIETDIGWASIRSGGMVGRGLTRVAKQNCWWVKSESSLNLIMTAEYNLIEIYNIEKSDKTMLYDI